MIGDMIIVLLLLATSTALSAVALWQTIAHDGLGVRPAPRSHRTDPFGTPLES